MHKQMLLDSTLEAVLQKYKDHPAFLGLTLTDPNQMGSTEESPLHIACRKGELEDISILVAHGGNVNLIGDIGNTPLHEASLAGRVAVVQRLLELGADRSVKNEFDQTALEMASGANHRDVVAVFESGGRPATAMFMSYYRIG